MRLNTHQNTSPRPVKSPAGIVTTGTALLAMLAICCGPVPVLAQATTPAAPFPQNVDSGPKYKADSLPAQPAPPAAPRPMPDVVPVSPTSPAGGVMAVSPEIAVPPAAPVPPMVAVVPVPPGAEAWSDSTSAGSSIEDRLARLEREVQSLIARREGKHGRSDGHAPPGAMAKPDWSGSKDAQALQESIQQMVRDQVNRATDQAKRAVEQALRATQQAKEAAKMEAARHGDDFRQDAFERQVEAMERQREALERQMERIDSQIERLREKLERKENQPGPSPKSGAGPKAEQSNRFPGSADASEPMLTNEAPSELAEPGAEAPDALRGRE